MKKEVAVLDVGSSKLELYVGERGINNTFVIKAKSSCSYAGFMDGDFIEPENLKQNFSKLFNEILKSRKIKLKKIYIGVPAEFVVVAEKELKVEFNKRIQITMAHIDKLYHAKFENEYAETHDIINIAPMYYILSDGSKCLYPMEKYSSSLKVYASFIYCSSSFISTITQTLNTIGLFNIEFVSSTLATGMYLLDQEEREKGALLVDCGYISTSVSLIVGDGLQDLRAFSVGGGHITADLSEQLNLPFFSAELLKRKTLLCIDADQTDFYEVNDIGLKKVGAKVTNNIVLSRIDIICDTINKCIDLFDFAIPDYYPIYLTGGGVSYIKGAKDYMQQELGRKIIVLSPWQPQLNQPELSSVIGLLDTALKMEDNSNYKYFNG